MEAEAAAPPKQLFSELGYQPLATLGLLATFSYPVFLFCLAGLTLIGVVPLVIELWLTLFTLGVLGTTALTATAYSAQQSFGWKLPDKYLVFGVLQSLLLALLLYHAVWIVGCTSVAERQDMWYAFTLPHSTYADRQAVINLYSVLSCTALLFLIAVITETL